MFNADDYAEYHGNHTKLYTGMEIDTVCNFKSEMFKDARGPEPKKPVAVAVVKEVAKAAPTVSTTAVTMAFTSAFIGDIQKNNAGLGPTL